MDMNPLALGYGAMGTPGMEGVAPDSMLKALTKGGGGGMGLLGMLGAPTGGLLSAMGGPSAIGGLFGMNPGGLLK